jgi:hypothetical protein
MIGKLSGEMLDAVLEALPIEFSVLDENDQVLAWNKHSSRIFKRPEAALGKNVRECHPPKSLAIVERILNEMKEKGLDKARFYIDLPLGLNGEKQKILIEYYALRNGQGEYIGCLEATQNIAELKDITGEKRLMD